MANEPVGQRDKGRQGRSANKLSLKTGDDDPTTVIAQPCGDNCWVERRGAFGELAEQHDKRWRELGRLVRREGAHMDRHAETVAADGSPTWRRRNGTSIR